LNISRSFGFAPFAKKVSLQKNKKRKGKGSRNKCRNKKEGIDLRDMMHKGTWNVRTMNEASKLEQSK
jgi:hypothetical protein